MRPAAAGLQPDPKNLMAIGHRGGQESGPMNDPATTANDVNRRAFLRGGLLAPLMNPMGGGALEAGEKAKEAEAKARGKTPRAPGQSAVVGCGGQGRANFQTLPRPP